mgnify:CR=1 FL=1
MPPNMDNKLAVKQYKIILDETDLEVVRELTHEFNYALEHNLHLALAGHVRKEDVLHTIFKQIINQSNNEQTESGEGS